MKKDFSATTELSNGKVLRFNDSVETYRKLTEERVKKDDLTGALSIALAGLNKKVTLEGLEDVATLYADLGLFSISNRYWFYYLSKAPKEKLGLCYEELGINSFYLNDLTLLEYYFHKKYELDGYISRDNLDPEIAEFFDEHSLSKKSLYRIVYPTEKADVKALSKNLKKTLLVGDFGTARRFLDAMPIDSLERKEGLKDLAVSYFLTGREEKTIETNKEYLSLYGDDASVYCNLTEIYRIKGDLDKSGYYYQKAISTPVDDIDVYLKLATCAFERGEHRLASNYFEKAIKDDLFEIDVLTLYGLTLINSGEYQKAYDTFSKAYRLDPTDIDLKFYCKFTASIISGDREKESYLPLSYSGELPEKVKTERKNKINELSEFVKNKNVFRDQEILDTLKWGIMDGDPVIAQQCITILTSTDNPKGYEILSDFLIDERVNDKVKEAIVFDLVLSGEKNKISIAVRNFFTKVKIGRPVCSKSPDGILFFVAYALAYSKLVSAGEEWLNKLLSISNKIYLKLKGKVHLGDFTREEIATLSFYLLKLPFLSGEKEVCSIFYVNSDRLKILIDLYKGKQEND